MPAVMAPQEDARRSPPPSWIYPQTARTWLPGVPLHPGRIKRPSMPGRYPSRCPPPAAALFQGTQRRLRSCFCQCQRTFCFARLPLLPGPLWPGGRSRRRRPPLPDKQPRCFPAPAPWPGPGIPWNPAARRSGRYIPFPEFRKPPGLPADHSQKRRDQWSGTPWLACPYAPGWPAGYPGFPSGSVRRTGRPRPEYLPEAWNKACRTDPAGPKRPRLP